MRSALLEAGQRRQLTAVVHADIVGYSKLVGRNDVETMHRVKRLRTGLLEPLLRPFGGRLLNAAGDAFLLTFGSSTDAVGFAVELQNRVPEFDEGRPADELIRLRVGVEIGDVVSADAESTGDGINVAVRLQSICPPGGICISRGVHDHVRSKLDLAFEPMGEVELKNIDHKVAAFVLRYRPGGVGASPALATTHRRSLTIALGALFAAGFMAAAAFSYAAWRGTDHAATAATDAVTSVRPELSVAVLPFVNMSGDAEQTYLGDGISEDLTTDLSQIPRTVVIARESAFSYRGKQVDVRDIGRELGVRYVVEGSVRKVGDVRAGQCAAGLRRVRRTSLGHALRPTAARTTGRDERRRGRAGRGARRQTAQHCRAPPAGAKQFGGVRSHPACPLGHERAA